jgi:hypothetical protein
VDWIMAAQTGGLKATQVITHPLPVTDAGLGFCADGFCVSVQTAQRPQAYKKPDSTTDPSGVPSADRGVANYQGVTPDPYDCSGPSDDTTSCGGQSLQSWNNTNGDPTVDPGHPNLRGSRRAGLADGAGISDPGDLRRHLWRDHRRRSDLR